MFFHLPFFPLSSKQLCACRGENLYLYKEIATLRGTKRSEKEWQTLLMLYLSLTSHELKLMDKICGKLEGNFLYTHCFFLLWQARELDIRGEYMIHESSGRTFNVIYHRPNKSFIQFFSFLLSRVNINVYGISFLFHVSLGTFFLLQKLMY